MMLTRAQLRILALLEHVGEDLIKEHALEACRSEGHVRCVQTANAIRDVSEALSQLREAYLRHWTLLNAAAAVQGDTSFYVAVPPLGIEP